MSALPIGGIARLFHPPGRRHKAIMVLQVFFDESGMHGNTPATDIAGFIGAPGEWEMVEREWRGYLDSKGIGEFHYHEFENRTCGTPWEHMERWQRDPIRARLAEILAESALVPLNAGYRGPWNRKIIDAYHFDRYPTAYSFCFEMVMELALRCSDEFFDGEPIMAMFASSGEHSGKAEETFELFKQNEAWDGILSPLAFDIPKNRDALQAADMLAYECYQCLKAGTGAGYADWPLLKHLWRGPSFDRDPKSMWIAFHDEESMTEVLKRPLGQLHRFDPLSE